jgi:predicted P-loop ATPase
MSLPNKVGTSATIINFSDIASPADFKAAWLQDCQMDAPGRPTNNLANAMIALRADSNLCDAVAFDAMLYAPMLMQPLPGKLIEAEGFKPRRLTDNDDTAIQEYLQRCGLKRIANEIVHKAIALRAQEKSFHPAREYIESRQWDGEKRLTTWLTRYLGVEHTPYSEGIGQFFLISMMARTFEPGCQVDYMLVFEGEQGAGKSTACRILGGPWYSDSLPDITGGKDVQQHLPGKMLIEIGEMSALSRAESAALKAFLTRAVEQYRPSYGRNEVVQPRQCVFIGTTNKAAYLRDETGARRFWPVKVGAVHFIDTVALRKDRDQLLAEAYVRYKSGAAWYPDPEFERIHIRPQQEDRFDADVWEEAILKHLIAEKLEKVTIGALMADALNIEPGRKSRADQNRVSAILEHLGWRRLKKDSNGNIPWGPPEDWAKHFVDEADFSYGGKSKEDLKAEL